MGKRVKCSVEDKKDLKDFRARRKETSISYEQLLKQLKQKGKI